MRALWVILLSLLSLSALADDAFGDAQWIGATTDKDDSLADRSIVVGRDIRCRRAVKDVMITVCGLGAYELYVDGKKFGHDLMAPAWSDYRKTVFYNTYDLTPVMGKGAHRLEVLLGNGFYHERGRRYHKLKSNFGPLTLLLRMHITYRDGSQATLVSDRSWAWKRSEVTYNSLFGGEDIDRTQTDGWHPVVVQTPPEGQLRPQLSCPVTLYATYGVARRLPGMVFDMGQNLAGMPRVTLRGRRGQQVKVVVGETLRPDGQVSQKQTGSPHYYVFTLKGEGQETFQPHFSYYGFRYIQLMGAVAAGDANPQGLPVVDSLHSCFISNAAPRTGSFACSDERLNRTHAIIDAAIRSNWQHVWTDCPHREKLGWLEQDWLNAPGLMDNYECRSMVAQTMQLMADAQHADGAMPEIAPEYITFEGAWAPPFQESPEWGGALVALPHIYRQRYGDDSLLRQYAGPIRRYTEYLATRDSAYILSMGLGDWYDYDGSRAGFAKNTPVPLVTTAHYYLWTKLAGLTARADSIRAAFIAHFELKSQASLAIALDLGLYPERQKDELLQRLVDDIHRHGNRLTTGDIGTPYLFRVLIDHHQQELLYTMLNHDSLPGYGYQIRQGMTTLAEQWDPAQGASRNHFMLAHINNHLIHDLVGIQVCGDSVVVSPKPVGDIRWARGSTQGADGEVRVTWRIEGDTFVLNIETPNLNKLKIDEEEINRFCARRHLRLQCKSVGTE
ncbi:MAG: family 78 glycoside hydrolase catalytic domain [Prevotella sp.]|nr:family 78 glycoside hydrolase catalytic domain [Prevotella sp.]